jgi:uncharacterized protein (TIGR02246 family)
MASLGFHVLAVAVMFQLSPADESGMGPDTRDVRSVLDKYTKACNSKDFGSISQVFAHDPDIVLIPTYIPQRCVGWKNVAAWYKALFSSEDKFRMQHSNIAIRIFGSGQSACLVCDQDGSGTYQGEAFIFEGVRTTWVLEKQEGQWRVIHAHWSLPTDFE